MAFRSLGQDKASLEAYTTGHNGCQVGARNQALGFISGHAEDCRKGAVIIGDSTGISAVVCE